MINDSSSVVSKVTYDICSCSIIIEADSGETQTIPCDDIYEVWAIARVSEGMIENANNDIKIELFNWNHCVEEFALQTICINLTGYYYQIGNGVNTTQNKNIKNLPKNKFVYKTIRI